MVRFETMHRAPSVGDNMGILMWKVKEYPGQEGQPRATLVGGQSTFESLLSGDVRGSSGSGVRIGDFEKQPLASLLPLA